MKTSRSIARTERGLVFSPGGEEESRHNVCNCRISVWELGEGSMELELHLGGTGSFIIDPARVAKVSDYGIEVQLVDGDGRLRRGILSGVNPGWMDSMFQGTASSFDRRTDPSSAELYFHYYGQLQHQQNMLSDALRTGTYHAAISENAIDFRGKAVLDVGTGSGILALFAASAGARVVYAVEASASAEFAAQLVGAQPSDVGQRVRVIRGRVEEVVLPEKVDVLISEPLGTLLVNERMLESYIAARDRHLRPGGRMFPALGRIHAAAFSDAVLHAELAASTAFWDNRAFFGVDLTVLRERAAAGAFAQPVVDAIPTGCICSNGVSHTVDLRTASGADLQRIIIPLSLQCAAAGPVHGIATWFDVLFDGSVAPRWLSTAPGMPTTHWFQVRLVLETPLVVPEPGNTLRGELRLTAHERQSYDIDLELSVISGADDTTAIATSRGRYDLKEPYYRQMQSWTPLLQQQHAITTG